MYAKHNRYDDAYYPVKKVVEYHCYYIPAVQIAQLLVQSNTHEVGLG